MQNYSDIIIKIISMKIIKNIVEFKKIRANLDGTVGFIPTMGYLHEGHLSLVKRARTENDCTAVSIFVNPKQFGPQEDFFKYPRDIEKDLSLLASVKTDIVFLPSVDELYPDSYETYVQLEVLSQKLEGTVRPGHFTGVATILTKLFHIIQPTRSYFGQKDAQQVAIVKKMVNDLNFPLKVIVCDTIREPDGLAMSSRNVYLSKTQRQEAVVLYQSLTVAQALVKKGERDPEAIKKAMEQIIQATSGKIDYISVADTQTLEEKDTAGKGTLISLAVRFGNTRLIDNVIIE